MTASRKRSSPRKAAGRPGGKREHKPHPRAARMREEIVFAAAEAFARKGYRATTMQEIARAAGYTAASLYTYFRSKEEIFRAILATLQGEMLATFDEPAPSGLSFAQRLELLLLRQYELTERRKNALGVLLATTSQVAPEEMSPASDGHALFAERFTAWIRSNASPEDLGHTDPATAARVLMGISHAFFLDWLVGRAEGPLVQAAPAVVRHFLYGLSTARRPGPPR